LNSISLPEREKSSHFLFCHNEKKGKDNKQVEAENSFKKS
jgi:hypothetical protein